MLRTRLKFFIVTSGIAASIILAFCGMVLMSTRIRDTTAAKNVLGRIIDAFEHRPSDEELPEEFDPGAERTQIDDLRTFVVKLDKGGEIIEFSMSNYFSQEDVEAYVVKILDSGKLKGFLIMKKNVSDGKIIAAIDMSIENAAFGRLSLTVLSMGGGGILLLVIAVWFLSFWMVRPAEQSLEKQKRFISEASHELRTPLTVISAGVELLQKQKGHNAESKKWLDDIKLQTEKMTAMTAELLVLSKLEEKAEKVRTEFDLSSAIFNTALTFESVAFEQKKELVFDIQEDNIYYGNMKAVNQAVGILCDNAIKHSDEKSIIKISLKKQSSKILLSVMNTGGSLAESEIPLIFERFYRGSEARAATSGTGLGLAILKTLAHQNGWKIDVKVNTDKITFAVSF